MITSKTQKSNRHLVADAMELTLAQLDLVAGGLIVIGHLPVTGPIGSPGGLIGGGPSSPVLNPPGTLPVPQITGLV